MKRTSSFAPRRSVTCWSLLLLVCVTGISAKAATELEFQLTDGHGPRSLHIIVSNGHLRLQSDAQPGFELYFSAPTQTAYLINHPRRQYAHLDPLQLERNGVAVSSLVGALQNQLSGLDEGRRNRVNDFLKGLGLGKLDTPTKHTGPLRLVMTTKRRRIAGIPCHEGEVLAGNERQSLLCLEESDALSLPLPDRQALVALIHFFMALAESASPLIAALGITLPRIALGKDNTLPIALTDYQQPLQLTLTRVSTSQKIVQPSLPNGYRAVPLPLIAH